MDEDDFLMVDFPTSPMITRPILMAIFLLSDLTSWLILSQLLDLNQLAMTMITRSGPISYDDDY